jgi:hypothetical protein
VTVLVTGDTKVEADQAFLLNLVNLSAGPGVSIADDSAQGTIQNDDSATISIGDVAILEGNGAGTTAFVFSVTLSAAVDQAVSVGFNTRDISATVAGNDYIGNSGTLVFAANTGGPQTLTITVLVKKDTTIELDETFAVDLVGLGLPLGVSIADNSGLGTIRTDDRIGGRPGR